ncbi:LOW QUALITY PROTEIN: uncharacterized protein LOC9655780 [Selaginella moellendorffii]|uniref:LOW QUALITY PROTEIN: uncharacterized protein LOC9655780 n=1 Tax=Selaginella moellendorffii TaxID=88036 RepID=UPI000D1C918D|nr:LOW QUALITY PROTEIN: uncharacterized protein LOC9655780 [Selaginella moellendorffii]|eukprot:XP_024538282.1 LOW QUALITY PROTEIN: uncharacterized protein LOC9655780 [Selaginella moellendorffii]
MGKGSQEKRGKSYNLGDSCKLVLREGDIADGKSDAIVNTAHEWLLGGGGVDGAIHRAAGKELLDHCRELPNCPPGEHRSKFFMYKSIVWLFSSGFSLRVSKIIHTVGVAYKKTFSEEQARKSVETLKNAYKNSLEVARSQGIKFTAFPALSCGINGFPLAKAAQIALETIQEEAHGFSEIDFVLFNQATSRAWSEAAARAGLQPV